MALTNKLVALGDAIREKAELTEKMTIEQMAEAINNLEVNPAPNVEEITIIENGTYTPNEGIDGFNKVIVDVPIDFGDLPENLLHLTGDQSYKFHSVGWQSFLDTYGKQIQTENLTNIQYIFQTQNIITEIPFSFNSASTGMEASYAFEDCAKLRVCPIITGALKSIREMFYGCHNLPNLPDFSNIDVSQIYTNSYQQEGRVNAYCHSIRSIPMAYYKQLKNRTISKTYTYSPYYYLAYSNYNVDEIMDMPVMIYDNYTSNAFNNSFVSADRLKDFTFEVQENGSPYIASKWKAQTIDLSQAGYYTVSLASWRDTHLYNSGITVDKCIYNDATYEMLKNDPDNYVCGTSTEKPYHYSRYDKASAIRTINSLPDVSGSGGTNTIKFKGEAGLKTDNGAINTMTPEEIAVATEKGWTVSFV